MNQTTNTPQRIEGIVVSSTGSWYEVSTAEGVLNCRIRGRLRLKGVRSTNPVVVGDRVLVEPDGDSSVIVEIIPRRNYVIRRASNLSKESHIIAANIDRALLIVTLHSPTTPCEFVDRFLVTCEAYKVPATIVLGKADTLEGEAAEEAEAFTAIYEDAGYEVLRLSSVTGIAGTLQIALRLLRLNEPFGAASPFDAVITALFHQSGGTRIVPDELEHARKNMIFRLCRQLHLARRTPGGGHRRRSDKRPSADFHSLSPGFPAT